MRFVGIEHSRNNIVRRSLGGGHAGRDHLVLPAIMIAGGRLSLLITVASAPSWHAGVMFFRAGGAHCEVPTCLPRARRRGAEGRFVAEGKAENDKAAHDRRCSWFRATLLRDALVAAEVAKNFAWLRSHRCSTACRWRSSASATRRPVGRRGHVIGMLIAWRLVPAYA